ncbi:WD40 repeat-like protein [Rhizophagus irregularis]|uniref:WD40 repeat-like protein n=1 Tax=Rhizophagus irregularis TaxID=588596 RepID=A0A2N1N8J8_9GLOM|nr:WD40 repeat-like protein [Rhizophagus irregularis]
MSEPKKYCLEHTIMETAKTSYYGVSFNRYDPHDNNIFAVVGGRNVIIARLDSDKPVALKVVQTYVDDDEGENFYCCAWSVDPNIGAPLLAVAGATSIIKIINTSVGSAMKALTGHGNEINEIKFHPREPSLLFSASKDLSIRLWNLNTMQTVAIFGGECGHREPDVHLTGDFLASSGMDCAVKIWTLCTPVIKHAIGSSINSNPSSSHSQQLSQREQQSCCSPYFAPSRAVTVHYPIFSTTELHNNFIDCVRWYGDLLLSRCAADAKIVLWKPDVELVAFDKSNITTVVVGGPATPSKQQANFDIICELEFTHSDIWFIRFGFSYDFRMLATGNQVGKIYLWDTKDIPYYIDGYIEKKKAEYLVKKSSVKRKRGTRVSKSAVIKKPIILESDCKSTIRQIDFSKNSQWIVSVCDDGSIWCWKSNIDTTFQESIKGSGSSDDPLIID